MQPVSRQQLNRNKYVRITSFEGKNDSFRIATGDPARSRQRMATAASAAAQQAGAADSADDQTSAAAMPSEESNGDDQLNSDTAPKDAATKKKTKRNKSKRTSNVDVPVEDQGKDETTPKEPTSYAEAAEKDPVLAEEGQAEETQAKEGQTKEGAPESNTKHEEIAQNGEKMDSKPTLAGDKTFAQAANDGPADSEEKAKSKTSSDNAAPTEKASQSTTASSQASTAVDYPDIQSGSDEIEEEEQRRRDKEKAAIVAGARWAPLGVPVKRRLQTAAVLMHCVCMGTTLSMFFGVCAVPLFWPIIILYLFSILFSTAGTDGKLKRRNDWIRRLPIWTYFADYFPAKLHKTHELLPTRKYILGYHPHGIISHGAWAAFATEALGFSEKFPGITNSLVTLESNFHLPFYREYVLSMGLQSVSKQAITNILTRGGRNNEGMGRAATIVIGGARESLGAQPKTLRLVIKERKGFIKLALQTGADLVPVLAFGENDLYDQLDPHEHPWLDRLQRYVLKAWKFTVPLLHGRGIFNYDVGLMPYRRPLNIVVGKPIAVVQASNPDNTEINRLHDLYVEELQKIWDRYKDEFAGHRKEEMLFMD
ncbi:unnamed protein product [Discula destructiva]